ncbi:MAG: zf-HC2 domain-containing protein [Deltaproteobacteria bacterium]|nr:zf-HC2 domain-containing protein [Deltaproteobacteria bacterium]
MTKHYTTCADYEALLMESLSAPLDRAEQALLTQHLEQCPACKASSVEVRASWDMLDELGTLEPRAALRERTRTTILQLMATEKTSAVDRKWYEVSREPLAVLSALLVAGATLSLLSGLVWGSALPQGHLFFCAAMYTGLLVGAFSWIYSATTVNGVHLDVAARIGVLSLAITVAAITACPQFQVLAVWDGSALGRFLTARLGAGGSSLVFGFGYGLFPGFLAALFGGNLLAERPLANSLVTGAVVFLLASPVIYLQSAPFTSGVVVSWIAGTAVGTLCGVLGAVRVRQRVADAAVPS